MSLLPPRRKRARLATLARRAGFLALLQRLPHRPSLIVLNYHRVTTAWHTVADRGLVEATPENLAVQLSWLKRHFHVATLDEAQDLVERPSRLHSSVVLITFDDGYRDNYDVVFPILKSLSLPATFFLVTSLVGSRAMPWWDRIADIVRRSHAGSLHLDYPRPIRVEGPPEKATEIILRLYKDPSTVDRQRFLSGLEAACGTSYTIEADDRLFLDWSEAREMLAAGMSFGSHTHRHELLAKLTDSEQRDEIWRSKHLIQTTLGITCDALAYPVGSRSAFSNVTRQLLQDTGYRTAFSYYGGVNLPGTVDRFNVLRVPIDSTLGHDGYRLRSLLSATIGKTWP